MENKGNTDPDLGLWGKTVICANANMSQDGFHLKEII